ncbi:MFS transporter [soil metagenome]
MPAGELAALVGAVTGIQALATFAVLALATLGPAAAPAFGVAPHLIGFQVSLIYLAAALGSLAAGTLTQRHGAGSMSLAALGLGAAGLAGLAAGSIVLATLGSLLIGAGYALTNPAASKLLHRHAPARHRNLIFSIKQTGVPIGGIAAGVVLPAAAALLGWQAALALGSLLSLAAAFLLARRRAAWDAGRQPVSAGPVQMRQGVVAVWRHPSLRALSLAAFCFAAAQLCLMTFIVTMLVTDLAWTLVSAGATLSAVQLAGGLGRLGWGRLADWTGRGDFVLVGIGGLTGLAALSMSLLEPGLAPPAVLVLLIVFAVAAIGWNGVFMAEIARQSRVDEIGPTTGAVLFFTFAGVVIGPALFTLLYGVLGSYGQTFAAAAALPIFGSIMLLRTVRRA